MSKSHAFTPNVVIDRENPTTTYFWQKVSGPAAVNFTPNNTTKNATGVFTTAGTYLLKLTVSDGVKSGSDTVTVVVT